YAATRCGAPTGRSGGWREPYVGGHSYADSRLCPSRKKRKIGSRTIAQSSRRRDIYAEITNDTSAASVVRDTSHAPASQPVTPGHPVVDRPASTHVLSLPVGAERSLEVYTAFARSAGLPEGPSRRIEDLADLDRLDDAFTRLAEQQHTFEQSIAKDREQSQQLRQLVARVKALEERVSGTITREQRGYIYQRALASAIGLPRRSTNALWIVVFLMPAEVSRNFMIPFLAVVRP